MSSNLNIMKRVRAGELTVRQGKELLLSVAGRDTELTSTWKRLCRLESALTLRKLAAY